MKRKTKAKKQKFSNPVLPIVMEMTAEMELKQIESRLMQTAMTSTLALHLIQNRKKPASELLEELIEIEVNAGQFVGAILKLQNESFKKPSAHIAGALGFISIGSAKAQSMSRTVEPLDVEFTDNPQNRTRRKIRKSN